MAGKLIQDEANQFMQAFVSDPDRVQVPVSIAAAGSITLGRGVSYDYDTTGWRVFMFYADGDLQRHYNSDTTKTRTILDGVETSLIPRPTYESITITNNGTSAVVLEIEGM